MRPIYSPINPSTSINMPPIKKSAGIKEGFVITSVNKRAVNTVDEMKEMLNRSRGGVLIEGVYPNGQEAYYVFGLN